MITHDFAVVEVTVPLDFWSGRSAVDASFGEQAGGR
jgi:hypothetical protein